jgi:predicted DNA-binding WGR domain protein
MQKFLFLKNTKISIFGGILEFCLWANFGRIGSFGQFWVESVALIVAEACPKQG